VLARIGVIGAIDGIGSIGARADNCATGTSVGVVTLAWLHATTLSSRVPAPQSATLNRTRSWYHARLVRAACAVFLVVALALPLVVACAETAHGPLAGASDAWARAPEPTPSSSASAPHAAVAWEGYAELLRLPTVTSGPFTSRGHQPEQQVDVRVNDVARAGYAALVTDTVFADGSLLAELSHNASGNAYVMRKRAGIWSYFELDPRGVVLASGALVLCAGCHAQASADQVFGLPRTP
jgi:hypothetical protein